MRTQVQQIEVDAHTVQMVVTLTEADGSQEIRISTHPRVELRLVPPRVLRLVA